MNRLMETSRPVRERVAELAAAAEVLSDPVRLLALSTEALKSACPRGKALSFTRLDDGRIGAMAMWVSDKVQTLADGANAPRVPWIVDLDHVPAWQQDRWVEPIRARVHGPEYFTASHPAMRLLDERAPPDYGRLMVCAEGRLLAWLGLYVEGRRALRDDERAALAAVAQQLVLPLRLASALQTRNPRVELAPRQREIVGRVARGWTNKRIAKDLDISPATVKTLLERLFRVSGAANRAALVQWWRGSAGTR